MSGAPQSGGTGGRSTWLGRGSAHPSVPIAVTIAVSRAADLDPCWPGSFFEFEHMMAQLTDPAASGDQGNASSPAFDVVVPSLPGYGFSGKPTAGWDVHRIARAGVEVMRRLGYDRFIASGSLSVSTGQGDAVRVPSRPSYACPRHTDRL
jgi:hypothetical protein